MAKPKAKTKKPNTSSNYYQLAKGTKPINKPK